MWNLRGSEGAIGWLKRKEGNLDRGERKKRGIVGVETEEGRKLITAQMKGTLVFGFVYFEDRH